jgi:hypothetical protein
LREIELVVGSEKSNRIQKKEHRRSHKEDSSDGLSLTLLIS